MAEPIEEGLLVVAYGGGINSTAMLVGFAAYGMRPDAILFADTGGERPETYTHLNVMRAFITAQPSWPELVVVRYGSRMYQSLEDECLKREELPQLAYGAHRCSYNWKRRPQETWTNRWPAARAAWARGERITKAIGFDAEEDRRARLKPDEKYKYRYPLIDWGWGRDRCTYEIRRVGLPVPEKSSCFFCPARRKEEVIDLAEKHPDLFRRAVEIERNAAPNLTHLKGLGRRFSWETLVAADTAAARDVIAGPSMLQMELPCGCFDGDNEE